jgi:hypothetical protein
METTTTTKINICGRVAKLDENYGPNTFIVKIKRKTDIVSFYSKIAEKCYSKNFANNPFEQNSYGLFYHYASNFCISPPLAANGDTSWSSYDDEQYKIITFTLIDDELNEE